MLMQTIFEYLAIVIQCTKKRKTFIMLVLHVLFYQLFTFISSSVHVLVDLNKSL